MQFVSKIPGAFSEYSGGIPGAFSRHSWSIHNAPVAVYLLYARSIQTAFSELGELQKDLCDQIVSMI